MNNTYSTYNTLNELAKVWDKLSKQQQNSIVKMIAGTKEKEKSLDNQITIDEFIAQNEEAYWRKTNGTSR